jgi:hypothetical protein
LRNHVACSLLEIDNVELADYRAMYGPLVDTFVYQELRRQAKSYPLLVILLSDVVRFEIANQLVYAHEHYVAQLEA